MSHTDEVLEQNLEEQNDFQRLFRMELLFEQEVERPSVAEIKAALEEKCGQVDIVSGDKLLSLFAIEKYKVEYDKGSMPAQVLIGEIKPFDQQSISALERTQFWETPDSEELLNQCHYSLMLTDFMASGLDYKLRCELLGDWLEAVMSLFPSCKGVWIPSSGKLLSTDAIRENQPEGAARFMKFGVNIRFFNIQGTDDMMVDSLGLYAIGLPDVQYHYHTLDPNDVTKHAYNVAYYIWEANAPIQDGETVAGLENGEMSQDVYWKCQYEMALIQPSREVMDVCAGQYAAGEREE